MLTEQDLPDYDGKSAYRGALRFLNKEDEAWKEQWGKHYGKLMPNIKVFALDAFGIVFGLLDTNEVAIFWSETGELEDLGVGIDEFYRMILSDPDSTINLRLYNEAVSLYGEPGLHEHFALKIESVLGGELSVENIGIMNAIDHFKAMAKIAHQIRDMPIGARILNIELEQ